LESTDAAQVAGVDRPLLDAGLTAAIAFVLSTARTHIKQGIALQGALEALHG
jgi:hypothetical protein